MSVENAPEPTARRTLTVADSVHLETVLGTAQRNAPVGRLIDGVLFVGEARNVCDAQGGTVDPKSDVRDAYLRVVGSIGEHFWPVAVLMDEVGTGHFVADYKAGVSESDQPEMVLLVTGDPATGFAYTGPVRPNDPDVDEYIETHLRDAYWWYVPVRPFVAPK